MVTIIIWGTIGFCINILLFCYLFYWLLNMEARNKLLETKIKKLNIIHNCYKLKGKWLLKQDHQYINKERRNT